MKRTGEMWIYQTSLNVWEEHVDEKAMYPVFRKVIGRLRKRGFSVQQDPHTLVYWPTLARTHWVGRKGDLEFHTSLSGRHLQVEFFQNVVSGGNGHGGRYDFDKYRLMPLRMRLLFIVEMTALVRVLTEIGYSFQRSNQGDPLEVNHRSVRDRAEGKAAPTPLGRFNERWRGSRFERDETGWPCAKELASWQNGDRDKVVVRTGDTRYLRRGGRLQRCTCWPNMNGMWQVCYGGEVTYVSSRELFVCERPDLEPRRLVTGQAERLQKELSKATETKQWRRVAELARVLQRIAAPSTKAA
jgi:hypothetical protein